MHECRIFETKPFLKKDPIFPLCALYKKPYSVVRAEPDGSIFSYHSPHSMNVYLSLRYSRLYLNWGFVEDENNLRLFEYNTEFPYTGTIVFSDFGARSFENGRLIEKETPGARTEPKFSDDILSLFSETETEFLIQTFCTPLKRIEKERQTYRENLSRFLHEQIPNKNKNLLFDETDIEKLHQYIYFDNIYVEDEYETVLDILIELAENTFKLAQETFKNTMPKKCTYHAYKAFIKEERRALRRRLHDTFSRLELNSLLKFWSDYAETDHPVPIPDKQKIDLLTLFNLVSSYGNPPCMSHYHRHKHLQKFLADNVHSCRKFTNDGTYANGDDCPGLPREDFEEFYIE